jgi:P27 family predicted phage terminase small subunit
MRGRKPLPTATKEATGALAKNPQRRNHSEPVTVPGIPPLPASLEGDEVAIECWNKVCKTLHDMGILTMSDVSVMELYCSTYSQWRWLSNYVRDGNCRIENEKGNVSTSPEANQVHKYSALLLRMMAELGLTPSSRSRIHAAPKEEEDPFTDFLKRRMGGGNN